jgi:carbon catabolite-derepressing protein kinase
MDEADGSAMYDMEDESSAMEEFMASSPPAWNAEMPVSRVNITAHRQAPPHEQAQNGYEELDLDDVEGDIQDIPNAHFDVLDSSLPGYLTRKRNARFQLIVAAHTADSSGSAGSALGDGQEAAERAARALLSNVGPPAPSPNYEKPLQKPRWHFGIRSRSPPMEVMLEIYKTLNVLGMQWRKKEEISMPDIGPPPLDGYPDEVTQALEQWAEENGGQMPQMNKKPPGKKEAAAQDKGAQNLYLVETRARYGDIMVRVVLRSWADFQVRMDLQLYRVDRENYLVDFRNIGYYRASDPSSNTEGKLEGAGYDGLTDPTAAVETLSEPVRPTAGSGKADAGPIGGVSGPFHFLEMACQLIAELANG